MTQSNGIHCILDERATNDRATEPGQRQVGVTLCGREVERGMAFKDREAWRAAGAWDVADSFCAVRSGSWHRPCKRCAAVAAKTFADVRDTP